MTAAGRPDRTSVLAAVDLDGLLEGLGTSRGLQRRGSQFPCPAIEHEQTGSTPPTTTTVTPAGYGLWHCHGCGAGGTAIDALLVAERVTDVGEAFSELQSRRSLSPPLRTAPPTVALDVGAQRETALCELERYVADSAHRLWSSGGRTARAWLASRGLGGDELKRNRLGFDPGRSALLRAPRRLPAPAGPSVTIPLLSPEGVAVYAQARQLRPGVKPRYLNPCSAWLGASPRVGAVPPNPGADHNVLIVAEGMIDAILASRCFDSCGLLGAGQVDDRVAREVVRIAAGRPVAVCLDGDAAGRAGGAQLLEALSRTGARRVGRLSLPRGDVNDLLLLRGDNFERALRAAIQAGFSLGR